MQTKHIHEELKIRTSPERLWEILSRYGDVSRFHAGVVESHAEGNSQNTASLGCERVCNIVDMGLKIILKERIVDYVEGRSYTYEVYEWKNFPLRRMTFGFTISSHDPGTTTLAIDIAYLAKPALLTPLLALKMRRLACDVLLGYKHYAETGEARVPVRKLKQLYRKSSPQQVQFG